MPEITVRALTPEDWAAARAVRLAALADAPEAFASSLADNVDRPEEQWREMLTPERGVRALAEVDGAPAGVVGAFSRGDVGEIIWMWVDPAHRGSPVGPALVAFAVDWCERAGLGTILWVVDANARARRMYERLGFVATGESQPVPGDDGRTEVRMAYRPAQPPSAARAAR